MRELQEGETVEMQGSGRKPYVLKNIGGVLSCNCPGWRFQSLPIERRTCRHLRILRGDAAEEARIGTVLATSAKVVNGQHTVKAPPLLLAETWNGEKDVTGWHLSEKLDGVRGYWDGKQFLSRQGNRFYAPAWFTEGLPLEPLDGELWIGRKKFQRTVSIVRRQDESDLWKEVRFLIFDAPAHEGPFEKRLELIKLIMEMNRPRYAMAHPHIRCEGLDHFQKQMDHIESIGGEGLMLRQPGSIYQSGRSATLLKAKRFKDSEARVIGHQPGMGRHKGRLGALLVEMANGVQFAIGTGFTDVERERPVPIGSVVNFRFQELSDASVPRFPSFLRVRGDIPATSLFEKGDFDMATLTRRRFEFVGGSSDKFWEVETQGNEVIVRFGRNGTSGQTTTKTFPSPSAAEKHVNDLVRQKIGKGYLEVK